MMGSFFRSDVGTASLLRVTAIGLGFATSVAIARLAGPEVKGTTSAFAALLSFSFLFLNFDVPQQALRFGRSASRVEHVLPWLKTIWTIYAGLALVALIFTALLGSGDATLIIGVLANLIVTQSGVVAVGTRGPVMSGLAAVVQQLTLLLGTVLAFSLGVLDVSSSRWLVVLSVVSPLIVYLPRAPISVLSSRAALGLRIRDGIGQGFLWQIVRSMQTVMLKLDLLVVTWISGAAIAGYYSVAISFAMLSNVIPQQVANDAFRSILRGDAIQLGPWARRSLKLSLAVAIPAALFASWLIPLVYGEAFRESVVPAIIALVGASSYGVTQIQSNYIRTVGSRLDFLLSTGIGLLVMVLLLISLISPFGAIGASTAFSAGQLTNATVGHFVSRRIQEHGTPQSQVSPTE